MQPDPLGMPDGPARWAYARSAPTMYVDPTGEVVPLALLAGAWAAAEIGLSLYDVYNLADVWLDPCATDLERQLTTAATTAGIFLPGAGYGAAGRVLPRIDNPIDLVGASRNHIMSRHGPGTGRPGKTEFPSNWDEQRASIKFPTFQRTLHWFAK